MTDLVMPNTTITIYRDPLTISEPDELVGQRAYPSYTQVGDYHSTSITVKLFEPKVTDVWLATVNGIEAQIESKAISDPSARCFFAVRVKYFRGRRRPKHKSFKDQNAAFTDVHEDLDIFVTDGTTFYRARLITGPSPLTFTEAVATVLREGIAKFAERF